MFAHLASECSCSGGAVVELGKAIRNRKLQLIVVEPKNLESAASEKQSPLPRLVQKAMEITQGPVDFIYTSNSEARVFEKWRVAKTPEILVFDRKGALVYQGAIAADPKGDEQPELFLSKVLDDIEAGRPSRWTKHEAFGCALLFGPLAR